VPDHDSPWDGAEVSHREPDERRSVLVVEDEFLLALLMQEEIESLGHRVVGPTGSVAEALDLIEDDLSAALLDINLGGDLVTPVAYRLIDLDIPFGFLSAYSDAEILPESLRETPFFKKPLRAEGLAAALQELLGSPGGC
jgi:CheY-like chemotaxis protein